MNLIAQRMMTGLAALFASVLITACGAHSTNQSTETFTVYEDAPKMSLLDLGAPGNSLGDVYHFSAPLHSERGGPVTGEVIGSKTLVKMATDANPNLERRATLLFFTFADRKDQIIAFGAADYSPSAPEFDAGQPVVRPVLGGTGKYIGARGQVTSTRDADGSYTQVFTLLKYRNRIQRCLEQCRVDAIAVLTELENEPNCLDSGFQVRRHISFILS